MEGSNIYKTISVQYFDAESIKQITHFSIFLHLHEIVEGLYFHIMLSVCLCVCVSVSVSDVFLRTKFQPNG